MPEKAEKAEKAKKAMDSFDGGREWMYLHVFPHVSRELALNWSNVAVVLHQGLCVWSRLFQNVSEGVLFSYSVD